MSQTLFAALGASQGTSDLYTVDLSTGALTSIGPIGYAVTGLAFDPADGSLYGVTSNNSGLNPRSLIKININTGAGTLIGALNLTPAVGSTNPPNCSDIAFDGGGNLYGWLSRPAKSPLNTNWSTAFCSIDKSTGAATAIGNSDDNTSNIYAFTAGGLDFLDTTLYHIGGGGGFYGSGGSFIGQSVDTVDITTGHENFGPGSGIFLNALSFDSSGTAYGVAGSTLETINLTDGTTTTVATLGSPYVDGIAFQPVAGGNFDINFSPTELDIYPAKPSQSATITGSLLHGANDTAVLSIPSLPSGITATISPSSISESGGTATITVTVAGGTTPGNYLIQVNATDSDETVTKSLLVVVLDRWCLNAKDVVNPSSTTTTVGADYVTDSQTLDESTDLMEGESSELTATLIIDGDNLPGPGQYTVQVRFNNLTSQPMIFARVNGIPLFPEAMLDGVLANTDVYITGKDRTNNNGPGPTYIPIADGDILEIVMAGDAASQLNRICFFQHSTTPRTDPSAYLGDPIVLGASPPTDHASGNMMFDSTFEIAQVDMAVLDDGTIYVVQALYEGFGSSQSGVTILGITKWDGNSWSVVTDDLWGLGYKHDVGFEFFAGSVSIDTDGTDVWVAFAQPDGTLTGGKHNTNWRVKKYSPSTNSFTELGSTSGQRAIISRSTQNSYVGMESEVLRLKVGPDGKVWVGWSETLDVTQAFTGVPSRPHLWYWDGAWVSADPPDPPNLHSSSFWGSEEIADVWNVEFCFRNHLGVNNWPCVMYQAEFATPTQVTDQDVIYAEFDGSSWNNVLQFKVGDIWTMGQNDSGTGWWLQGIVLLDDGQSVIAVLVPGTGTTLSDRGVVGKLKADGSAFEPYVAGNGTYWSIIGDINSGALGWAGGWDYPSVNAAFDSKGNLFTLYTVSSRYQYGDIIAVNVEIGTGDGWLLAGKKHFPISERETSMVNKIVIKGTNLFLLQAIESNADLTDIVNVIRYPIVYAQASILWFYKDGEWHNVGADPQYNLWVYKSGQWHSSNIDPNYAAYGNLNAAGGWHK